MRIHTLYKQRVNDDEINIMHRQIMNSNKIAY